MQVEIDERELGTILAALRHWQETSSRDELLDIATNGGRFNPLTPGEVDAFCERINTKEAAVSERVLQLECPDCGEGLLVLVFSSLTARYVARIVDGEVEGEKVDEEPIDCDWDPQDFLCPGCGWIRGYRRYLRELREADE